GEHMDQRAISDLQVFNEVEAVEFGATSHHGRQIPAFRRRRTPNTSPPILQAEARERAIDGSRGRRLMGLNLQRRPNRPRPAFAQCTCLKLDAQLANTLFEIRRNTVPGTTRRAVSKIEAVQTMPTCPGHPHANRALAEPELSCSLADAHTGAHRLNHCPSASLNRRF